MNPVVLIPARMASTRLPGKPLADICGKPMIIHVMQRALDADIGPVAVATDSPEIFEAVLTEQRKILTEPESMAVLNAFHVPTIRNAVAHSATEALVNAESIGFPVAMKILSW